MNSKHTKRALFSSFWALLLCFAMLLGTTFAWFTDTASTSVNKIQAGNLKVELGNYNDDNEWVDYEGKTLTFLVDGEIPEEGTQILWEPGCTYYLEDVMIRNTGNLALKFKVNVTGINGDAKLNEVIDWTIQVKDPISALSITDGNGATADEIINTEHALYPDETATLVIKGHMQETAGNEYQGLSIENVAITVVATQAPAEYDSFDNTYDLDATLPNFAISELEADDSWTASLEGNEYHITSAAQFVDIMNKTSKGHTNSWESSKTFVLDTDIDFGGMSISGVGGLDDNIAFTFDGNGHTISNFVINAKDNAHKYDDEGTMAYLYAGLFQQLNGTVKNLTVRNATVIGDQMVGVISANGDSATIQNCKVYDSTVIGTKKVGAVVGYVSNSTVTDCYAENCLVVASDNRENQSGAIVGYGTVDSSNTSKNVTVVRSATTVSSATELKNALPEGGNIVLLNDLTLSNWETVKVSNTTAANATLILEGNGKTISGLTKPFLNAYGMNNLTINNLTVKDSTVIANGDDSTGNLGAGVILEEAQWANLYMDNCHAVNTKVTAGDTRTAALVGYWVGGGEIKNCSVDGCEVTSEDAAAGIVGHRQSQSGYEDVAKITNCSVKNTELTSENTSSWRTGTMIGTVVSGTVEVSGCTSTSNTLTQGSLTNPGHEQYGRIPAPYGGVLKLDGTTYNAE